MVWRSFVNVKDIKRAVDDSSLDTTLKEVVEVVSNAPSTMLEKASDNDISGLQCYMIRNLNNKLNTDLNHSAWWHFIMFHTRFTVVAHEMCLICSLFVVS